MRTSVYETGSRFYAACRPCSERMAGELTQTLVIIECGSAPIFRGQPPLVSNPQLAPGYPTGDVIYLPPEMILNFVSELEWIKYEIEGLAAWQNILILERQSFEAVLRRVNRLREWRFARKAQLL